MTLAHKDAHTLARILAEQFANEVPWSGCGDVDSDDACGQVAHALNPTTEAAQEALLAELEPLIGDDLTRRVSECFARAEAYGQDGGYLFGLAVGQLLRVPALAPQIEQEEGAAQ